MTAWRRRVFLSTTSFAILPVGFINGQPFRRAVPGPITSRLIRAFGKRVGMDIVDQALRSLREEDRTPPGVVEGAGR